MTLREYLQSQACFVESPYAQVNLRPLVKITDRDSEPYLINGYSVKNEKIFCHICGAHRHYRGITAKLSDNTLILFGRDCAEKHFGAQIWERCFTEFKRLQDAHFARYRIISLRDTSGPMRSWLQSNRHRVQMAKHAWDQIAALHPQFEIELAATLKRHHGRIVEIEDIIPSGSEYGHTRSYQSVRVLCAVRSAEALGYVHDIDKDLIVVESFLQAVANMPETVNDQTVVEYARRLEHNVRRSAQRIDEVLSFTADAFSPATLKIIGAWSDAQRLRTLRNRDTISPRNIAASIRRTVGDGYERPPKTLASVIPRLGTKIRELNSDLRVQSKIL